MDTECITFPSNCETFLGSTVSIGQPLKISFVVGIGYGIGRKIRYQSRSGFGRTLGHSLILPFSHLAVIWQSFDSRQAVVKSL